MYSQFFGAKTSVASKSVLALRFVPPLPNFLHAPKFSDFLLKPFTIWAPHVTFQGICPPILCPKCGNQSWLKGRAQNPRWIRGLRSSELLVAARYSCSSAKCNNVFLSTDDGVMQQLGTFIANQAPFVLTHQSGVTKE